MAKTDEAAPGAHAFLLCELEWMRRRLLSRLACEELTAFTDELGDGDGGDLGEDLVERVRLAVEEVEELVISVGHRLAALPAGSVRATAEEVEAAAAAALEDGIADAERAMHAARWIGVEAGARALWMLLSYGDATEMATTGRASWAPPYGSCATEPSSARQRSRRRPVCIAAMSPASRPASAPTRACRPSHASPVGSARGATS
jgi:hypothetical protein